MDDDPFEQDEENLPVAIPVGRRTRRRVALAEAVVEGVAGVAGVAGAVAVEDEHDVSPFLMDLVREDCRCTSLFSGLRVRGCNLIVDRCREHPVEVYYQCPRTGRSPLHEAAIRCSCPHIIRSIMEVDSGRSMDLDLSGNSPLHLLFVGATTRRVNPVSMDEIVRHLLGPSPSVVARISNRDGLLPLHFACSAPESMIHRNIVEQLLRANSSSASRVSSHNQTPLHLHCRRRNASAEVASMLIEAHPPAMRVPDSNEGWVPLHYAAASSNQDLIRVLIAADASSARLRTSSLSQTALHIICRQHPTDAQLPAIQALIDAAPDTVTWTDAEGYTPLHFVCRYARISTAAVRALADASSMAAKVCARNQYLPLHYACEVGADPEIIRCLLDAHPDGARALTRKNDTALSLACATNQSLETVGMLLKVNPAATSQANDYGFVPLHCSCQAFQPTMGIVQALVQANPSTVTVQTNAGEKAIHLASSNAGVCVGVIEVLTATHESLGDYCASGSAGGPPDVIMANKVGNTPLHYACFHGTARDHIETLAVANPRWITVRNNAGYSPLQILCKNGRIDDRIITLFSRIAGPDIFSTVDLGGNTPLHSAMREETDVDALRALIQAYPDPLRMKTAYGDLPLHLACLRRVHPAVVRETALASSHGLEKALVNCKGAVSPLLVQNKAGQTPIGIAMEEFQRACRSCCVRGEYSAEQRRSFDVLAVLVKILHYGPSTEAESNQQSLVGACVSLHRRDVRLDPLFIRRALHLCPEEARVLDENGYYPLHIEASIPVEKMSLLDGPESICCDGTCHQRMGLLHMLVEVFPEAAQHRNPLGDFPLSLMIQNGRPWDSSFAMVLRTNPPAFHWVKSIQTNLLPLILERISNECGVDAMFDLIRSRPILVVEK